MGFQVSPGVNVTEIDLTTIVPAVSTTEGAIAGVFRWGPIEDRELISNEDQLVARFGRPTSDNFETFFTAANFLAYGNKLYVSRAADANAYNAVANTGTFTDFQIKNRVDYDNTTIGANVAYIAKWAGDLGNSLKISVCDSANAYNRGITPGNITGLTYTANATTNTSITGTVSINSIANTVYRTGYQTANIVFTTTVAFSNSSAANATTDDLMTDGISNVIADFTALITTGDYINIGNTSTGTQYVKIESINTSTSVTSNSAATGTITLNFSEKVKTHSNVTVTSSDSVYINRYWEFFNFVDAAPSQSVYVAGRNSNTSATDEIHAVVVDEDGAFSGTPGQVLEVWEGMSRATDGKGEQGGSTYYRDVINQSSKYVWWGKDRSGAASALSNAIAASTNQLPYTASFARGADGVTESDVTLAALANAYDQFKSAEDIDVSLILGGKSRFGVNGEGLANYIIDNICEYRKDCVLFVSPQQNDVVSNPYQEAEATIAFRNSINSSSYAVIDSGYKYQYDRYNDVYRWIPLNGDVAGTVVRTDDNRDPWFSPAGFNRGQIKNVVKLAFNPDKANRDQLYKNGINPIVTFPGQGTVLYGDKTALAKPSAFDRINVRRLFIVLEKAIATAAKFTLFEFNDEFTRATFRNLVEPYLRDIQGRRGIYAFRVVCDDSNNTPEVIDRNEFIGDIYIKPARSINFIQLNFVAVRTGVEFNEVIGKF
jgi:hypothetical protein